MRPSYPAERVLARLVVDSVSGCWLWPGGQDRDGYGQVSWRHGGRSYSYRTHKVVFEYVVGLVPLGRQLDHLCRTRACANPAHLEPVTGRVNVRRGVGVAAINAVRTHCVSGHPFTPNNTYRRRRKGGGRTCKTCVYERAGRTDGPYSRG